MSYFRVCEKCGATLDPGERCTCEELSQAEKAKRTRKRHQESRRAKVQEVKEIREKLKKSCLLILDDLRTTPGERLKATEILHDLTKGR